MADEIPALGPGGSIDPNFDWSATRERLIGYGLDPAALDAAAAGDGLAAPKPAPKDQRTKDEQAHDQDFNIGSATAADFQLPESEIDAEARTFCAAAGMSPSMGKAIVERALELEAELSADGADQETWRLGAEQALAKFYGPKLADAQALVAEFLDVIGGDFAKMLKTSGALNDVQLFSLVHNWAEHLARWNDAHPDGKK